MPTHPSQKGFTLVELAISLVIIGLLVGGMLKGRQLMQNARITSTAAQLTAVEAAMHSFRAAYNALPGDMPNAKDRIPNCANCQMVTTGGRSGNGGDNIIGDTAWSGAVMQSAFGVGAAPISDARSEPLLFWAELAQAGLINGVSYNGDSVTRGTAKFGTHAPLARVGGGLSVAQVNGTSVRPVLDIYPAAGSPSTFLSGPILLISSSLTNDLSTTPGANVLDPGSAAQIDSKLDDGLAMTGRLQAFGHNSSTTTDGCFAVTGRTTPFTYNEKVSAKDCGLAYQLK